MQKPMLYLASGLMIALLFGLVIATTTPQAGGGGGAFSEKYVAKLTVRVHRGSWDAWKTEIVSVHYDLTRSRFALDIGKALWFTGTYKVCAVATRGGMELDKDCQTVKLSPGDTKDVTLSLVLGETASGQVRITIYDEGGEIKDEEVINI